MVVFYLAALEAFEHRILILSKKERRGRIYILLKLGKSSERRK